MSREQSFGASGPVGGVIIVALGALGVAAMFQDYAHVHKPGSMTIDTITLKYLGFVMAVVLTDFRHGPI